MSIQRDTCWCGDWDVKEEARCAWTQKNSAPSDLLAVKWSKSNILVIGEHLTYMIITDIRRLTKVNANSRYSSIKCSDFGCRCFQVKAPLVLLFRFHKRALSPALSANPWPTCRSPSFWLYITVDIVYFLVPAEIYPSFTLEKGLAVNTAYVCKKVPESRHFQLVK